uniref:C2H2-type domain-containing protein n=1 Tax=Meloidogyne floridensis TaxID=298350 RepID=A0A915NM22_9BILA
MVKEATTTTETTFICELCGTSFNKKFNKQRHMKKNCPIIKKSIEEEKINKIENIEDSKPTTSSAPKQQGRKKGKKRASSVGDDKKPVTKKQKLKESTKSNENGGVLNKKHFKLNVENISLITSVHPSGIEGIMDLVADVVMKDGSIKSVLTETLKNEAPKILFDYYERVMELKDQKKF